MKRQSPYQLGYDSAGSDVDCPFGQYDQDGSAYDQWQQGREDGEQYMADEFADSCDPSMRDLYE